MAQHVAQQPTEKAKAPCGRMRRSKQHELRNAAIRPPKSTTEASLPRRYGCRRTERRVSLCPPGSTRQDHDIREAILTNALSESCTTCRQRHRVCRMEGPQLPSETSEYLRAL